MINKMMDALRAKYTCKTLDAGVFAKVVIDGANFVIHAYEVSGVGRVATIQMKRLIGFWEMQSVIITPFEKEAPIFYYNRHREKGAYTYRVTHFDGVSDAQEDELYLEKVNKKQTAECDAKAWDAFNQYMAMLDTASACKIAEKKKKVTVFVEEIRKQGGIAVVDIFRGNYDASVVAKLCNEVLFGLK